MPSNYFCPNCQKVNGKTTRDAWNVWACDETVKKINAWNEEINSKCGSQIRQEEPYA